MSEESLKKVVDVTLLKERENKIGYEIVRNRLKVFHLDYYISENNELIKDITLSFFDNKLYSIHISKYNSAVEKLLTKDLGKPKIKREESKQPKNKNSTTSVMKDWKTNNKNIICWSYVDFFYDNSIFVYSLRIEDRQIKIQLQEQLKKSKKD